MSRKKNDKALLNSGLKIDEKIEGIKIILHAYEQIFILLESIIERFLLTEHAKACVRDGTIDKLIQLFDIVSKECDKLTFSSVNFKLPIGLRN